MQETSGKEIKKKFREGYKIKLSGKTSIRNRVDVIVDEEDMWLTY